MANAGALFFVSNLVVMIRNLLILIAVTVVLALMRWLIKDVARAVIGALKKGDPHDSSFETSGSKQANRLVKDSFSGTYIDERFAIKDTIGGESLFFESKANRDAYRQRHEAGQSHNDRRT